MLYLQAFIIRIITQAISFEEANYVVGGIEAMHSALVLKNYYMPDLTSSVVTCEYLLNVALGKCFTIEKDNVKIGQLFKKVSKIMLFYEIEKACTLQNINLGFTLEKLPDKKWLTNVLYTLNKESVIVQKFFDSDKVLGITKDDLELLKSLDTFFGRKKQIKFFKRTHQQVEERKHRISKQKLQNIKLKLLRKKIEQEKIEQKIREYQNSLQNLNQPHNFQQQEVPIFKKQKQ